MDNFKLTSTDLKESLRDTLKSVVDRAISTQGDNTMEKHMNFLLIGMLLITNLLVAYTSYAGENKITALNPQGKPPPIPLVPLVPRLDTLAGKTVYLVDVRFMCGDIFLKELQKVFAEKYPQVKTVFKQKKGQYTEDDPELWAEIKQKGHAMIMAIGH